MKSGTLKGRILETIRDTTVPVVPNDSEGSKYSKNVGNFVWKFLVLLGKNVKVDHFLAYNRLKSETLKGHSVETIRGTTVSVVPNDSEGSKYSKNVGKFFWKFLGFPGKNVRVVLFLAYKSMKSGTLKGRILETIRGTTVSAVPNDSEGSKYSKNVGKFFWKFLVFPGKNVRVVLFLAYKSMKSGTLKGRILETIRGTTVSAVPNDSKGSKYSKNVGNFFWKFLVFPGKNVKVDHFSAYKRLKSGTLKGRILETIRDTTVPVAPNDLEGFKYSKNVEIFFENFLVFSGKNVKVDHFLAYNRLKSGTLKGHSVETIRDTTVSVVPNDSEGSKYSKNVGKCFWKLLVFPGKNVKTDHFLAY
ncbi:uncharacterized protein LOC126747814 [Anthonomus grandis grandis]|uniref:uncharacterized protein LOC126747814 n=1 Tax=Anthonomus grandis grandis TaxID=2921223 RepID=UPI002165B65B|nr:uncharacterized protein LOC126747814 [Anthonomus grandis grandis]